MNYVKVSWNHSNKGYPILIYSEINDLRIETRKIEVFMDGMTLFAPDGGALGEAELSESPIPDIHEIASDPQFRPIEITRDEFERMWETR